MSYVRPIPSPSASFFFTVRLKDPSSKLLVAQVNVLRQAVRACRRQAPFEIGASVVLPNRLHTIWTLPPGDTDYGKRLKAIKSHFARHVQLPRGVTPAGLWQRRYWECPIETPDDLAFYEDMIQNAALSEGLVKRGADWPYYTPAHSPEWDTTAAA